MQPFVPSNRLGVMRRAALVLLLLTLGHGALSQTRRYRVDDDDEDDGDEDNKPQVGGFTFSDARLWILGCGTYLGPSS
jgi:hypothetical protein